MTRSDQLGVTSIIRALEISPKSYKTMIHFFRSTTWSIETVRMKWSQMIKRSGQLYYEAGKPVLIGDGVKKSKESKKMPCVKNSTKNQIT